MRKQRLFLFFILPLFLFSVNLSAQTTNFDSVFTVAASPEYNYRNPVFEPKRFTSAEHHTWLFYERHKINGGSDIIARRVNFFGYGSEFVITNSTTDKNISPTICDSFVVWQSDKNGNWDLYYSRFNGTEWSAPVAYPVNTSQAEEQPCIVGNGNTPGTNIFLLTFKRDSDIIIGKFISSSQTWEVPEKNITDTINPVCSNPVLTRDGNPFRLMYLEAFNQTLSYPTMKTFTASTSPGIMWQQTYDLTELFIPQKMVLAYENDINPFYVINFTNYIGGVKVESSSTLNVNLSVRIPGISKNGRAILMPFLTEAYFSAFGCFTTRQDSSFISLSSRYNTATTNNLVKQKFIGLNAPVSLIDGSIPLFYLNLYKIRYAWEQTVNGKIEIRESSTLDYITNVSNVSEKVSFSLSQNFPNPFNPSTKINYEIKSSGFVSLKVFDLLGKEVAVLVNENQNSGSYAVDFNSSEFNLPSGIYFYRLKTNGFTETKKMMLVK